MFEMLRGQSRVAKRLRTGPTLLLRHNPGEQVLMDAVHRFDPLTKRRGEDKIQLSGDLTLRGPVELTPELIAKAELPVAWPVAYVADGFWNGDLLRGLAKALNGALHPDGALGPDDPAEIGRTEPVTFVYLAEPVPSGEVCDLVKPHLPAVTIKELAEFEEEISYFVESADNVPLWFEIRKAESYSHPMDLRPPAARHLGTMPHVCNIFFSDDGWTIGPAELRWAGQLALAIARTTGGVALDINRFRLERPENVHLGTA